MRRGTRLSPEDRRAAAASRIAQAMSISSYRPSDQAPTGPAAPRIDPSRYAIAVTMTKSIPTGMNIMTVLNIWFAASMEEAVGMAVQDAQEINPEHQIFTIAKLSVREPRDSDGSPEGEKPQALSAQHDSAGRNGIAPP